MIGFCCGYALAVAGTELGKGNYGWSAIAAAAAALNGWVWLAL